MRFTNPNIPGGDDGKACVFCGFLGHKLATCELAEQYLRDGRVIKQKTRHGERICYEDGGAIPARGSKTMKRKVDNKLGRTEHVYVPRTDGSDIDWSKCHCFACDLDLWTAIFSGQWGQLMRDLLEKYATCIYSGARLVPWDEEEVEGEIKELTRTMAEGIEERAFAALTSLGLSECDAEKKKARLAQEVMAYIGSSYLPDNSKGKGDGLIGGAFPTAPREALVQSLAKQYMETTKLTLSNQLLFTLIVGDLYEDAADDTSAKQEAIK